MHLLFLFLRTFVSDFRGAVKLAEIIPFVPAQDNACEGNKYRTIFSPLESAVFCFFNLFLFMNVYINSKAHEFTEGACIAAAVAELNLASAKGIAIAINNNVIPRQQWEEYVLQPDDKVMLIRASQGG